MYLNSAIYFFMVLNFYVNGIKLYSFLAAAFIEQGIYVVAYSYTSFIIIVI